MTRRTRRTSRYRNNNHRHFSGPPRSRPYRVRVAQRPQRFEVITAANALHFAKERVMSRNHTHRRAGFTLVELLVVIGIIALLISMLLPALNKARQAAETASCLAQMRSLGQAAAIYQAQYRGSTPPLAQWCNGPFSGNAFRGF